MTLTPSSQFIVKFLRSWPYVLNPHVPLHFGFCFHNFVDINITRVTNDFYVIKPKDLGFFFLVLVLILRKF